jgi:transcriptional regulator with XRE-family HTH domain
LDIGQAFGRAVKAKRAEMGISQEHLADKAGMARSFLSKIENGKIGITLITLIKLSLALDCSPSEILAQAEGIASKNSPDWRTAWRTEL